MKKIAICVLFAIVTLAAPLLAGAEPVPAAQPAPKRLLMTYGDYRSPSAEKVRTLITTGQPNEAGIDIVSLGWVHGATVDIWKSGSSAWIGGTGKTATTTFGSARQAQAARPFEGRKANLVLVQLDMDYVNNKNADAQGKARTSSDEAVTGYITAAKDAGAKLVFYVLPGNQHTTHKMVKGETNPVKETEADFQPELLAMDAECQRLSKAYGAVLAPTYRAFATLRTAHPEIERPVHCAPDKHLHTEEAVLAALVIGRAFLGEGDHPKPTSEELLASTNKRITADNVKLKQQGKAEKPLITIEAVTWQALQEAATAQFPVPATPAIPATPATPATP